MAIVAAVVIMVIIGIAIFMIRKRSSGGGRSTAGFQPLTTEPINVDDDDEKLLTGE